MHEHWFDCSKVRERVQYAYAISVHKAQGSQFQRVAVVIDRNRLVGHPSVSGSYRPKAVVIWYGQETAAMEHDAAVL